MKKIPTLQYPSFTEIPQGVYTLEDLKTLGEEREWCPYFMTRHLLNHATIVVYNYQYMLDPKVRITLICITYYEYQ
jgi:DEAD_2